MYKVIEKFIDLKDDNYMYEVGDVFPREGAKATKTRINELAGTLNKRGIALIEEVIEEEPELGA